jgi:hypothetical protein
VCTVLELWAGIDTESQNEVVPENRTSSIKKARKKLFMEGYAQKIRMVCIKNLPL